MSSTTLKALALGLGMLIVVVAGFVLFGGDDDQQSSGQAPQQESGDALEGLGASGEDAPGEETTVAETTADQAEQPLEGEPVSEGGEAEDEAEGASEPDYAELNATQEQRVRGTVSAYIVSAYGYTGSDVTIYARGIEQNVVLPEFYDSAGGEQVKERVQQVREGEVENAAVLERFEIEQRGSEEVVGTAYYAVGDSYDEAGTEVEGGGTSYREQITLVPQDSVYKVRQSSGPEEVE